MPRVRAGICFTLANQLWDWALKKFSSADYAGIENHKMGANRLVAFEMLMFPAFAFFFDSICATVEKRGQVS